MPDVLIVDDDDGFVETCALMLRHDGYSVEAADSVHTAMTRLQSGWPDAMLLDWKLRDGTGLDVLQWTASRQRLIPTALITGFWMDPEFERAETEARRLGIRECIQRGIDFETPAEIVRRLLDPLWPLHKALLADDSVARDVLAEQLPLRIRPRLQAQFRLVDIDLIGGAAFDAAAAYLREPSRFDPVRHVSVERFAYTLARRILWNALRADGRRRAREQEYARLHGEIADPDVLEPSHGRALIEQALASENEPQTRAAIRAWLDGEHGPSLWLAVPSIRALPIAERRAAIERCKDAFRTRVKRLARRTH